MTLYKTSWEGSHGGGFTPEGKAEELACIRKNIFSCEPSYLLREAEWVGVLSDLLNSSAEELDQEKLAYISSFYVLLIQLENLIREDCKDKFAAFLTQNHELVRRFPTCEVFSLLCHNNAPACVSALLDSPLGVEVDVNCFGHCEAMIPLEVAASKLSLPLVQTLLEHGADANTEHAYHLTVLDTALIAFRSHKLVKECTVKDNTMDLILTLCNPDLEEAVSVTSLLAFHTKNVYGVLSELIDERNFTEMTILLFADRNMLLAPSGECTFKKTPVAKFISRELKQVESEYDEMAKIEKKRCLNDAWMVAESVWYKSKRSEMAEVQNGAPQNAVVFSALKPQLLVEANDAVQFYKNASEAGCTNSSKRVTQVEQELPLILSAADLKLGDSVFSVADLPEDASQAKTEGN